MKLDFVGSPTLLCLRDQGEVLCTSTKTATRTLTNTPLPTNTRTPTWTATHTYTFTPTDTATATETPTPTITPSVPEGESWKFYYYAGSVRIAMRLKNVYGEQVYYFFTDHLGSTNVMTDANGNVVSETLYKAWGEIRYSSGSSPTDYSYTGQRSEMDDIGLMFYNARFYDPELGRFAQADTIVPDNENTIAQDRFAYGANNPISNSDPTGHCFFAGIDTAICLLIEMLATGALAGYGYQVAENMAEGIYGVDALADVDTTQVVNVAIWTPAILIAPYIINTSVGMYYQDLGLRSVDTSTFSAGTEIINSAQSYINLVLGSESDWTSIVPKEYREDVKSSFDGIPVVSSEEKIVYRYWGNVSGETGSPWYATNLYNSPADAKKFLALPIYNSAEHVSVFHIPNGVKYLMGEVASKAGNINYGLYATGGGVQIYLPDPNKINLVDFIR